MQDPGSGSKNCNKRQWWKIWANFPRIIEVYTQKNVIRIRNTDAGECTHDSTWKGGRGGGLECGSGSSNSINADPDPKRRQEGYFWEGNMKLYNLYPTWEGGRQELLLSPRWSPLGCGEEKGDKLANISSEDMLSWNIKNHFFRILFTLKPV